MKKKHIFLTTIIYFLLLGIYLQFAFDYYIAGTLIYAILLLSSIIAGHVSSKKSNLKQRKVSPFLYAVSLLLGLVLISGFTVMAAQNFITLQRAEKLIHNINHYQKASGHLPKTLNELQPLYMSVIPRVSSGLNGTSFEYSNGIEQDDFKNLVKESHGVVLGKKDYYLKFKSYYGVVYYYDSVTQKWNTVQMHDQAPMIHPQIAFSGLLSRIKWYK